MRKISDCIFIKILLNILFLAAEKKQSIQFQDWALQKRIYNKRINRLAIKYINLNFNDANSRLRALLTISSVLRVCFKVRVFLLVKYPSISSKKLRIFFGFFILFCRSLKKTIFSIASLNKTYSLKNVNSQSKIVFTIGFPEHSFNYLNEKSDFIGSSFADFYNNRVRVNQNDDLILISLDEYIRHSKSKESFSFDEKSNLITPSLKRYKLEKSSSWIAFLENMTEAFLLFFRDYLSLSPIDLFEYSSRVSLIPYSRLFKKENSRIEAIYILPFSDYEYFNLEKDCSAKLKTFYYSENILIPPFKLISDNYQNNEFYLDGNFGSFGAAGDIVGFTYLPGLLKRIAKELFCQVEITNEARDEYPCLLGFERPIKWIRNEKRFVISIFDVPPESEESQLNRALMGDMTADIDFIDRFLGDFLHIIESVDFVILYKPKYSLTNYDQEYKSRINSLINKFCDKFVLLDPYTKLDDVVKSSNLVLSFPYTSTQALARRLGIESFYYIPDYYVRDFIFFGRRADCFYGIESLNSYILDLNGGGK